MLQCVGPVDVRAAQLYGNHCAKVTWQVTFATLQKVKCDHLNTIARRTLALPAAEEVLEFLRHTRRANNVFLSDF